MTIVASIGPSEDVHDINVISLNGRHFMIDILKKAVDSFYSTVTVSDPQSGATTSVCFTILSKSVSANDNYQAAIEFIIKYLSNTDSTDRIEGVHNRCNCPFVSESEQNSILNQLNIANKVQIN